MEFWQPPVVWSGQPVFIVGGGPSVATQDISLLQGRNVIVVNSSYETVPFAHVCFFGDHRWYMEHKNRPAFEAFERRGKMATVSKAAPGPNLLKLRRFLPPPGLVKDARNGVVSQRTSLQGAMNLACHLAGWNTKLVIIGADMGRAPNGKTHHHSPHRWKNKAGNKTWDMQMDQLIHAVPVLKDSGVDVVNVGMSSRLPWWPKVPSISDAIKCVS